VEHPEAPIVEVVLLGKGDEEQLAQAVGQPVRRAEAQVAHTGEAPPPAWTPLIGVARQRLGTGHYPLCLPSQGWTDSKRAGNRSQVMVGALAGCALAGLLLVWQFDRQRAASAEADQAKTVAQQTAADRKLLNSLLQKRESLGEQLTAMGGQVGGKPESPPLELLRQVTESAPPGIWLTEVSYTSGKPLQLQGSTRNGAQVNRFMTSLEHIPGFRRVEMGYVRSCDVDGTPVTQFQIACTLTAEKPASATTASARREETP
jgi:Tfp pilus assembly protein PilN